MKELFLSLNDFNMPKVYDTNDANYILIIRLILLEPGTFPSHPKMGVGIKSRYRYNNDENFLMQLENDIANQINAYLPSLYMTNISLAEKNNLLYIIIDTTDGSYALTYNEETNTLNAGNSYVLDDL